MPSFKILTLDRYILHNLYRKRKRKRKHTNNNSNKYRKSAQSRRAGTDHRHGESGETYCRSCCQGKQQNKRQPPQGPNQVLSLSPSLSLSLPNLRLHIPSFLFLSCSRLSLCYSRRPLPGLLSFEASRM